MFHVYNNNIADDVDRISNISIVRFRSNRPSIPINCLTIRNANYSFIRFGAPLSVNIRVNIFISPFDDLEIAEIRREREERERVRVCAEGRNHDCLNRRKSHR